VLGTAKEAPMIEFFMQPTIASGIALWLVLVAPMWLAMWWLFRRDRRTDETPSHRDDTPVGHNEDTGRIKGVDVKRVTPDRGGWGAAMIGQLDSRNSRDSRDFSICYPCIFLSILPLSSLCSRKFNT
jgi:hypothetical protein